MAIRPSVIRSRIAHHLAVELGPAGWTESTAPLDRFPGDSRQVQSLAFVVGLGSSDVEGEPRGTTARGWLVQTTVIVRCVTRLAAPDYRLAYDEALDNEAALVASMHRVSRSDGLELRLRGIGRAMQGDTLMLSTLTWTALHNYPAR